MWWLPSLGVNAMSSGSDNPLDAPLFHLCAYYSCFSPCPGPCHPNPCHNNGECQPVPNRGDVFTDYICKCPAGFDGVHCQNSEYSGVVGAILLLRVWGPSGQHWGNNGGCWQLWLHQALGSVGGFGLVWALQSGGKDHGMGIQHYLSLALHLRRGHGASSNGTRRASRLSLLHTSSQPCCGCVSQCPWWLWSVGQVTPWVRASTRISRTVSTTVSAGTLPQSLLRGCLSSPIAALKEGCPPWDWLWGQLLSFPTPSPRQE